MKKQSLKQKATTLHKEKSLILEAIKKEQDKFEGAQNGLEAKVAEVREQLVSNFEAKERELTRKFEQNLRLTEERMKLDYSAERDELRKK